VGVVALEFVADTAGDGFLAEEDGFFSGVGEAEGGVVGTAGFAATAAVAIGEGTRVEESGEAWTDI
jgi:hypothetical protein